ncbi:MAG: GIDE domain-containing protein [Anaerolineales bacterium]
MTSGEDFLRVLFWLGGGLCCGVPLLIFAAVAFYAWRKHTQNLAVINSAVPTKISTLKSSDQPVRLEGVIKQVPQAIDGPPEAPLAFVRLKVEVFERNEYGQRSDEFTGWRGAGDKLRGVPFLLEDESGSVWVDPQGLDKVSLGEGVIPTREAAEAAAIQVGIDPRVFNLESRAQLWELRGGQRVTVIGVPALRNGQLVVGKVKDKPFVVTSLLGQSVQLQTGKQAQTGKSMAIVFGVVGLLAICCGALASLVALLRALPK